MVLDDLQHIGHTFQACQACLRKAVGLSRRKPQWSLLIYCSFTLWLFKILLKVSSPTFFPFAAESCFFFLMDFVVEGFASSRFFLIGGRCATAFVPASRPTSMPRVSSCPRANGRGWGQQTFHFLRNRRSAKRTSCYVAPTALSPSLETWFAYGMAANIKWEIFGFEGIVAHWTKIIKSWRKIHLFGRLKWISIKKVHQENKCLRHQKVRENQSQSIFLNFME